MDDINQEIDKLSIINSASLINLRINKIWLEINKIAVSGNYSLWNSNLDRVWCELGSDLNEDSKEIIKFNKLNKEVSNKLKKLNKQKGFSQYSQDEINNISELYEALINKEFFLRRLMNKQGKGTEHKKKKRF